MTQVDAIAHLKKELTEELAKAEPDLSLVLTLSSKIAETDPNKVRFTVDAAHVNRLGLELVSKRETALSELIKNSYDADASFVNVVFNDDENTLTLTDNGVGMTRKELIDGFMRLSTGMKSVNTYSSRYNRYRAGRKGIGRFAAQRLGDRLTIITRTQESDKAHKISINWEDFKPGVDLITIASDIEEVSLKDSEIEEHGTKLIIGNLREVWSKAQIKRVYRYASDILLPYPVTDSVSLKSKGQKEKDDPGFSATFAQISNGTYEIVADAEKMYLQHSLAVVEGGINAEGKAFWRLTSNKYDYDSGERRYVTKTFQDYKNRNSDKAKSFEGFSIGNVSFKAYYFNIREKHFPKNLTSIIAENLRVFGGIRLYRNGFRVLPYGERYDDWLRLDFITRNRSILPPASNNNFFGFVKLTPESTGEFEEVASREGLLENDSYSELRDFVADSIVSAMVEFAYVRNIKAFANQAEYIPKDKPSHETRGEYIKDQLARISAQMHDMSTGLKTEFGSDGDEGNEGVDHTPKTSTESESDETIEIPKRDFENMQTHVLRYIDETNIYRVLGGLGLAMAEFTHEIKYSVTTLNKFLNQESENPDPALSGAVSRLLSYVNLFEGGFQSLSNNQIATLDLRECVNSFISTVDADNEFTQNIRINLELEGNEFFIKEAHEATILAMLMNLYSNSKKATVRAGTAGSISILLKEKDAEIELYFSDQGDGISDEDEDEIFNLFFTRSQASATSVNAENDEMLGMGLGLPIVRELLRGINGTIELVDPIESHSTTFLVKLPKETDEELLDEMY